MWNGREDFIAWNAYQASSSSSSSFSSSQQQRSSFNQAAEEYEEETAVESVPGAARDRWWPSAGEQILQWARRRLLPQRSCTGAPERRPVLAARGLVAATEGRLEEGESMLKEWLKEWL